MRNRSQVTIFIIIAILIVAAIALVFFIMSKKTVPGITQPRIEDPNSYIGQCSREAAINIVDVMLPQGGWINPTNYRLYENKKVGYLCYTNFFYRACVMQEPLYFKHWEDEITGDITGKINTCFNELKSRLEKEDYTVEMGSINVTTEIVKGSVKIVVKRDFEMSKQGDSRKFSEFKSSFNSPLYNLAFTAQEIANQEAKYCNFEYQGYMIFYPEYNINRVAVGQGINASRIYTIQDRYTGKQLNMAVRSCAIPAGL